MVEVLLIGCAVLVMVGCAGVRSEAPQKEEQGHTEATASEEARCSQTRTFKETVFHESWLFTTNDVPGCPKGGLLSGTDKKDQLGGKDGDDEIHGLGGSDEIAGGPGDDVIYGGPGDDTYLDGDDLDGDDGDDVIYGGEGIDWLAGNGGEDVLYGGDGNDAFDRSGREGRKTRRGTNSIVVQARTATMLASLTMWTAVARRKRRF